MLVLLGCLVPTSALLPAQALRVPLAEQLPALALLSTWQQVLDTTSGPVAIRHRGAFPVGDGEVFGCFGLADRAATVQSLSGPTYQTDEPWAPDGHFGAQRFALRVAGQDLELPRQTVARVRGANFVVTEDRGPHGVALVTLNFAVPGQRSLFRLVEVQNGGEATLADVELLAEAPQAEAAGDVLRADYPSPVRPYRAEFAFTAKATVAGNRLTHLLGTLPPGGVARVGFVVRMSRRDEPAATALPTATAAVEEQAGRCLAWWRERLRDTARVTSDPPRVADLIEDWKVVLLTQRSSAAGLYAGLVNHRVCRVRELAGPLLLCLRYHLWSDARCVLQAIGRAAGRSGVLPQELPLDVAWNTADVTDVEWARMSVPAGGLGSLVVLFHHWYWRASGDLELVRAHLPFLQRCLDGQSFTADGLQAFGGDEAHLRLHGLLGDRLDAGAALVAHDPAAGRVAASLDANVAFLMANLAMGELRFALDRDGGATPAAGEETSRIDPVFLQRAIEVGLLTERRFWRGGEGRFAAALSPIGAEAHPVPIADCNLRLQWLGWTFASAERNRHNLRGTLRELWRAPDAVRVGLTPGTGFATGATQGLLLYSLTDLDDRSRDGALAELLRMAGPAGEWGELVDPDGLPTGMRVDRPDRCQPGPSGINLDAICFALTGIRYAAVPGWDVRQQARFRPRLPPATTAIDFRDIRRDGRHLHLHMDQRLARMTPAERERLVTLVEKGMVPARDPEQELPRFTYRVEMLNAPPDAAHIVCGVNLGRGMDVQYLAASMPSFGDTWDPPLDPQDHWPAPGAAAAWAPRAPTEPPASYDTLVLALRPGAGDRHGKDGVVTVDAGLPWSASDLPKLWLTAEGTRRCRRIVFEPGVLDGGAAAAKPPGFWRQPVLRDALAAFTAAGGVIEQ